MSDVSLSWQNEGKGGHNYWNNDIRPGRDLWGFWEMLNGCWWANKEQLITPFRSPLWMSKNFPLHIKVHMLCSFECLKGITSRSLPALYVYSCFPWRAAAIYNQCVQKHCYPKSWITIATTASFSFFLFESLQEDNWLTLGGVGLGGRESGRDVKCYRNSWLKRGSGR